MGYDFGETQMLIVFLVIFGLFYGLIGLFGLATYIIQGLGILRISESHGKPNGWLGFIPIGMYYQLGAVSGELELGNRRMKKPGLWLMLIPVITYGAFFLVYIGMMVFFVLAAASSSMLGDASVAAIFVMFIVMLVVILLMSAGTTLYTILLMMTYHKIFSAHYTGTRPVFYMVLSAFVPLASGILLMKAARTPIINPPEYMVMTPMYNTPYAPYSPYSPYSPYTPYAPYATYATYTPNTTDVSSQETGGAENDQGQEQP